MEYIKEIAEQLLPVLATVLSGVLLVLGAWVTKLMRTKLGLAITAEQQRLMGKIIMGGLSRAEQEAMKRLKNGEPRLGGAGKLEIAADFVMAQVRDFGLPELARDKVKELLESRLGVTALYSTPSVVE